MKISQFLEWNKHKHVNFEPAYQRKGNIWSLKDKEYLIDTILKDLPVPELFLYNRILPRGNFVFDVVDGKQRLSTIIEFSKNEFQITIETQEGDKRVLFKNMVPEMQEKFYKYELRYFEIKDLSIEAMFDIFVRINRTGRRLSAQEIRNAKFRGDFINLAKSLCEKGGLKNYFIKRKIIGESNQKRMGDVEFMLELLAYLKNGVQDKKKTLDRIIGENEKLQNRGQIQKELVRTLNLIDRILPNIKETRLNQKSDFYSLFGAINDLDIDGYNLENPRHQKMAQLILLSLSNSVDTYKEKGRSKNPDIENYYRTTQEGTDTKHNRIIRINYIKSILSSVVGRKDKKRLFSAEVKRLLWNGTSNRKCQECGNPILTWDELEIDHKKPWSLGGPTVLKNGRLAHVSCNRARGNRPR